MRLRNFIISVATFGCIGLGFTSCEDMLTVDTGDKMYTNANDTLYSYLGILKGMQSIGERQVIINELRGDLCTETAYVTDTLHAIANFDAAAIDGSCSMLNISDYYAIINNCNLYIANADTSKVKSNIKFMIPEYAQVQAIRAWTYMQLVQLYGEVPFITEPVTSLDVITNFNYAKNLVNRDNLLDRLLEQGLDKYVTTEYPRYGTYNNGASDISASLCFIPIRVLLGDLYLMRGASEDDYRKAAQYYFDYLGWQNNIVTFNDGGKAYTPTQQYCEWTRYTGLSGITYQARSVDWGAKDGTGNFANDFRDILTEENTDIISLIPSSANKLFGTMMTRVADIFGYTPSSGASTEVSENEDGDEEVESSGTITVTPNYKAQIVPSAAYTAVNKAQVYVKYDNSGENRQVYDVGDARYGASTQELTHEGEAYMLATKAARSSAFYYSIPIYRKSLIWLRLAEAINRAGFPDFAFAILKDGISPAYLPNPNTKGQKIVPLYNEDGTRQRDEEGHMLNDTINYVYTRYATNGALHYVDSVSVVNFFLDFSDNRWANNYGIHARGCGFDYTTSAKIGFPTSITGYNDTIDYDFKPRLLLEGVDVDTADKNDIINAVENIICDELALELAFEGYRFSDLVRMAIHKEKSGYKGIQWLAAKIADRGKREATLNSTLPAVPRDEALYTRLLNQANWYLTKPVWSGK